MSISRDDEISHPGNSAFQANPALDRLARNAHQLVISEIISHFSFLLIHGQGAVHLDIITYSFYIAPKTLQFSVKICYII